MRLEAHPTAHSLISFQMISYRSSHSASGCTLSGVKKWPALAVWWSVAATIFVFVLAGAALAVTHSAAPASATPKWVTTAKQRLAKLDVKTVGSMFGYSRTKFGRAWEDVDLNRCDTLLIRNGCRPARSAADHES
jgi:hypothetical protein